jgi:nitrous oxidase accessory protein NosD
LHYNVTRTIIKIKGERNVKLNKIGLLGLLTIGIGLGIGFVGETGSKTLVSSTAWVDDDDPTCGGNSPCFRTIQAAVDAVDDSDVRGGFVYILSGRYRENVVIKRVVSLIGVGNVYLEALDPKRPTILVSNGLESRPIEMITGLEIFGGEIGIELVDARIKRIAQNRIRGYPSFYSSLLTEAGIWIERAVVAIDGIFGNEISDASSGIFLKQGAVVEFISNNIIQRTGWGIALQYDAKVFSIRTNTFQNNQTHISMTGNGLAYILSNQMLLAEHGGIIVEAERASLTIENNLIANSNMVGIYLACQPDFTDILFRVDSKCPGQQGPRFEIVRNQITGGRYGIIVVTGQGKIVRNWILGNGFISEYVSLFRGAGLLLGLGQKMEVEISHNWIVNNRVGAAYSLFAAANAWDCQLEEIPPFEGKLTGRDNKIEDNELRDFCPPDYPWPPGFRK